MRSIQADVAAFHRKFGVPVKDRPTIGDPSTAELRRSLLREEHRELDDALATGNIVEIADGIADLIYVALGAANEYGIDMQPIWNEVQRTNMAKAGGGNREDGKILKPDGWQPPRIAMLINEQYHEETLPVKLGVSR